MKFEVVHTWAEYNLMKTLEHSIPLIVTASYIFAGPLGMPEPNCFMCLLDNMKDNGSFLCDVINSTLEAGLPCVLSSLEQASLEGLDWEKHGIVWMISRRDFSVEALPIHCHPLRNCTKQAKNEIPPIPNMQAKMDMDKRIKSGRTIFTPENDRRLIHRHSGIGLRLYRDTDDKYVPMCFVKSHLLGSHYYSYGRALDLASTEMSAKFEMLERYASVVPHGMPTLHGSYAELMALGYPMVSPRTLTLNKVTLDVEKSYGFVRYADQDSYRWCPVYELVSGSLHYLPEQVLYYDAQLVSKERRFIYETSNGCALGGSYEEAIVYALYELVERDAFLMHWYNRVAPPCFNIERIHNRALIALVRYLTCIGFEIRMMNITLETGIPAIWVAAIDRNHKGGVKCYNAAGAHLNPEKALEAALVEIATSISVYDSMVRKGKLDTRLAELLHKPEAVTNMEDHVYFYALEGNFPYIKPYYENREILDFTEYFSSWYQTEDHSSSMGGFLQHFTAHHPEIYVANMDNCINQELGLYCVKAIVPSLLTMTFGVLNQRLNLERIQKGAVLAEIRSSEIAVEEINTNPHPFP